MFGSQLEVLQVTAPDVPDAPALTPHFVAQPRGSPCIQLPDTRIRKNKYKKNRLIHSQLGIIKESGVEEKDFFLHMCWVWWYSGGQSRDAC